MSKRRPFSSIIFFSLNISIIWTNGGFADLKVFIVNINTNINANGRKVKITTSTGWKKEGRKVTQLFINSLVFVSFHTNSISFLPATYVSFSFLSSLHLFVPFVCFPLCFSNHSVCTYCLFSFFLHIFSRFLFPSFVSVL